MQFTVKLSQDDGRYRALCPELGLSAFDADADSAVDKLKSQILEFLCSAADIFPDEYEYDVGRSESVGEFSMLNGAEGLTLLYTPRSGPVN
jgi:hypothetical protein